MRKLGRPLFASPKNFQKKRCFMEIFENLPSGFFSQIVLREGRAKIKKRRFWPYFPKNFLIEDVIKNADKYFLQNQSSIKLGSVFSIHSAISTEELLTVDFLFSWSLFLSSVPGHL